MWDVLVPKDASTWRGDDSLPHSLSSTRLVPGDGDRLGRVAWTAFLAPTGADVIFGTHTL